MLQSFRNLAVRVGTHAWAERGLDAPGRTIVEDSADIAFCKVIETKPAFMEWSGKRQVDYAQAVIRNELSARAAHDLRFQRAKEKAISEWQLMERDQKSVEEIVDARLSWQRVSDAIDNLSQETRLALSLSAAGVPVTRIAQLLFMKESSVRDRIERARDLLKGLAGR